jgi:hypothetical protein
MLAFMLSLTFLPSLLSMAPQGTRPLLQSSELGPPHNPLTRRRVRPPLFGSGEGGGAGQRGQTLVLLADPLTLPPSIHGK